MRALTIVFLSLFLGTLSFAGTEFTAEASFDQFEQSSMSEHMVKVEIGKLDGNVVIRFTYIAEKLSPSLRVAEFIVFNEERYTTTAGIESIEVSAYHSLDERKENGSIFEFDLKFKKGEQNLSIFNAASLSGYLDDYRGILPNPHGSAPYGMVYTSRD